MALYSQQNYGPSRFQSSHILKLGELIPRDNLDKIFLLLVEVFNPFQTKTYHKIKNCP